MAKKSRSGTTPPGTPKVAVAPATPDGPNRKVRKEDARRQRESLQRKAARRKFYRWGVAGVIVVAVAIAGTAVALNQKSSPTASPPPTALANMQHTEAPWTNGNLGLKERLDAIGLPVLSAEQLAFHIHMLLQVFVDGNPVPVAQGIGINQIGSASDQFITVLHTHDASGVIHVESAKQQDYTLGEFFDVWGVPLSSTQIGAYANAGDKQVRVFLNGQPYTGDPRGLVLKQHEDIVVTYGTTKKLPDPIPSTYSASISQSCAGPPPDC
jgi:hypothetical protein